MHILLPVHADLTTHVTLAAPCLQVLYMQSLDDAQRLMVVDEKMNIMHCSESLAKMLGTTTAALASMQLPALIAPPAAQLHKRWIMVSKALGQ